MRQETGKTDKARASEDVSIQLMLDGHSFSDIEAAIRRAYADLAPAERNGEGTPQPAAGKKIGEPFAVELLTKKSLLAPAKAAEELPAREWFAAAGIPLEETDTVATCTAKGDAVALVGMDRALFDLLGKTAARCTTPLLQERCSDARHVRMFATQGLLYVKIWSETALQLAEVLPLGTEEDLLFMLERMQRSFPLKEYELHARGELPAAMRKTLGRIFASVRIY